MSNLQLWRSLFVGTYAPESFIDFGWYSAVACAVERRVWLGDHPHAILPNIFPLLISGPGVGKGLVLDRVKDILAEQIAVEGETKRQLIYLGPDSTTYPDLMQTLGAMQRPYKLADGTDYSYPGIAFVLDELMTLLNRDGEDIVTFLLEGFMGKPHFRSTKSCGKDKFKRCCVNLIAGTTPDQLQKLAKYGVFTNGLSSRLIIVYDARRGGQLFSLPRITPEWKERWQTLSAHIRALTTLFGGFTLSPSVDTWVAGGGWLGMQNGARANQSAKLDDYYARRNLTIQKLAIINRLSDHAELGEITMADLHAADAILRPIEKTMHIPLISGGRNELAPIVEEIAKYVEAGRGEVRSYPDILVNFVGEAQTHEIDEILALLTTTGRIKPINGGYVI